MGDICQVPVATSSEVCVCHSPSSDTARGACPVLLRGQREPRGCCESQSHFCLPKGPGCSCCAAQGGRGTAGLAVPAAPHRRRGRGGPVPLQAGLALGHDQVRQQPIKLLWVFVFTEICLSVPSVTPPGLSVLPILRAGRGTGTRHSLDCPCPLAAGTEAELLFHLTLLKSN